MMQAAPSAVAADNAAPAINPAHPRRELQVSKSQGVALRFGDRTVPGRPAVERMQRTHGNQAVLRMLGNSGQHPGQLHRKCSCAGSGGGSGDCAECGGKRDDSLNRKAADGASTGGVPPIVNNVIGSSGEPLDPRVRDFMEPRFGSDLSGVRVHTGRQAAESAAAVNALAYTAGRHIVFGAGQYSPDTSQGRSLIAHELAHAVQQGGSGDLSPQTISDPADASEHEADRAAEAALRAPSALESASPHSTLRSDASLRLQLKASAGVLQRRIVVDPGDQVGYVLRQLDKLCPQQLGVSGTTITQKCAGTPADQSCGCACDAAGDPVRTYTVHAYAARVRKATKTLWDGSQAEIPETTVFPTTWPFNNPDITVENEGSAVEFGSFAPNGEAKWYEHWRILAHELCGHGRLQQSYSGEAGKRPGHDVTIKTENDIAGEKGEPERGYSWNPRQGESFYNPIGDRSKIVFSLANGLHYEAP